MLAFEHPNAPTCRAASRSDLSAIHALEVAEYGDASYPYFALRQLFELDGANWTVAEEAGEVCGYVLASLRADRTAWLLAVAVAARCRSRGYGRALLETALAQCRRAHVVLVRLTVDPANATAYRLYKEAGFVLERHEPDYFGPHEPRDVLVHRIYH
ncbi:GNAT family N-acetyltransferase [Nocardia yunnanensis]|uniref:GNAT family N-acetyltransferase n=1 Tax=Nocardia yunnanensis TaxID=2382165 RepID=UPI0013C4DD41|nr:GNAT family N-acetyltransferase [Nocardia yunnanensis]